ncbi:MAG: hemerythrin domain-containing protein [Nitrosomonadales bacterium]|nr:hemerythrin domain-containing protein [Nitrosomonadales bacterium]
MMKMAFTKQLSVGNRAIDSAHKEVFGMIDRIARPIAARDIAALSEAFDLLENCLCVYFSVEENIARALDFDFTKHKLAHQDLLKIFRRIKDELTAADNRSSEFERKDCIGYLRDCLIRHIKEDGRPLKMVLETHFYDFNP